MTSARVAILMALGMAATPASAMKICLSTYVDLSDSGKPLADGTKEDNWLSDDDQLLRGAEYEVTGYIGGLLVLLATGNLGDGTGSVSAGCTGTLPSNANGAPSITVKVWSNGVVRGNDLIAEGCTTPTACSLQLKSWTISSGDYASTVNRTFTASGSLSPATWRAYAVSAFALFRSAGGVTGEEFEILVNDTFDNENTTSGNIHLNYYGSKQKFIIVHELGHRLLANAGAQWPYGSDCSLVATACPAAAQDHSMCSKEYQSCAFNESFAHFYAARAWNDNTEDDCAYNYYKDELGFDESDIVIDCFGDQSVPQLVGAEVFVTPFMEDICGSPFTDRGVEMDWIRAFWLTYTRGATSSQPGFPEMVGWIDDAFAVVPPGNKPFPELDTEANSHGGTLNSNWDVASAQHGIDH